MKFRNMAAASILLALGSAAVAQALPDSIKKAGKIVIANKPNYPPMEYKDPGTDTLMGFDIELGEALGKVLGVPVEWSFVSFEQMPASLSTGRTDLILSAMISTPERREVFHMVDYMKSGVQFYTLTANASQIKVPTDLCGKKVGMSRTTKYPILVGEWSKKNCEASGKPDVIVTGADGSADARSQLKQGRIVAAVQGPETLPYFIKNEPNTYVAVGTPIADLPLGIGVAKDNTALWKAVAAGLTILVDNGTYQTLLAKYGLESRGIDAAQINKGIPK